MITLEERSDLSLETYRAVCFDGETVAIGNRARAAMAAARRSFEALLRAEPGAQVVPPSVAAAVATGPASFGAPQLPARVVRGVLLSRLGDLLEGHAGCRPEVAELLAAALAGAVRAVPLGGATSPGEVTALSQLLSGLPPFEFAAGEREALLGGSPCAAALAADVALRARHRLALAGGVFALSAEAMNAPLDACHPALREMWGDRFTSEAIDAHNRWLAGAGGAGRRSYQAPVSYRIVPRVLGQAHRAVGQAEDVAAVSLRLLKANPVYLPPGDGRPLGVIVDAGSHDASAAPAIDSVAAAWADLCTLAERHTAKLHDGSVSLLPDLLAGGAEPAGRSPAAPPPAELPATALPDPHDAPTAMLPFVAVGFGERARRAAARTLLPGSEGVASRPADDVSQPAFLSFERHEECATALDCALAVLAASARRALVVSGRSPAPPLGPLLDFVRAALGGGDAAAPGGREAGAGGRSLGEGLSLLAAAFSAATLSGEVPSAGAEAVGATR